MQYESVTLRPVCPNEYLIHSIQRPDMDQCRMCQIFAALLIPNRTFSNTDLDINLKLTTSHREIKRIMKNESYCLWRCSPAAASNTAFINN